MRLKYRSKYIVFIVVTSFTILLAINLSKTNGDKIEDKSSRIIFKSAEKYHTPNIKEHENTEGIRRIPSTNSNSKSQVQPLPIPDSNAPIIICPLS